MLIYVDLINLWQKLKMHRLMGWIIAGDESIVCGHLCVQYSCWSRCHLAAFHCFKAGITFCFFHNIFLTTFILFSSYFYFFWKFFNSIFILIFFHFFRTSYRACEYANSFVELLIASRYTNRVGSASQLPSLLLVWERRQAFFLFCSCCCCC